MAFQPKALVFAGSARTGSMNKKLAACAARFAREAGAEATLVDLRDFPMPLYDGDLEAASGLPEHARLLKALMKQHHALLLACPEYNSSITPLLKNTIDWCSRREEGEKALECYQGKVAGLLSASAGALGGLRGLAAVRSILGSIGVIVLPGQFALSKADTAFGADGSLTDEKSAAAARAVAAEVVSAARKLHG